ncbi:MAG: hypothetical protein KKD33_10395 [Verrucomicrobia bacterium]|nr:hypothetical protein [Verrucomicrobiota bacterium]
MNAMSAKRFAVMYMFSFVVLVGYECVLAKDVDSKEWTNYFERAVVDGMRFTLPTSGVFRDGIETNVLQALSEKGYHLRSSSETAVPGMDHVMVKTMEFDAESGEQSQRIRARIVVGKNGWNEAMNGLAYLMASSTTMGGTVYKAFKSGPGDVCFVFKTEPNNGTGGPSVIFFYRDNVAVETVFFSLQTELIPLARVMESSIMDSPKKEILEAQVTLKPDALAVSPGILTAFVRLPAGFPVSGIISATCDGARSERMMLNEDGTEMIIKFRRQDIENALAQTGESIDINFVVRGIWQSTAGTNLFQGADSITKIVGAKEKKK